jgi:integrase
MKNDRPHRVPLNGPAIALLRSLENGDYLFSAPRGGPLSDMSISAVCRGMEVAAVPDGFRSTFKDWCRATTTYADGISELALSHVNSDATRAAYARDDLLEVRRELMERWGQYCGI